MSTRALILPALFCAALAPAAAVTAAAPGIELTSTGAANAAAAARKPETPDPRTFLFEGTPADFTESAYAETVEAMLGAYERDTARSLKPGKLGKVALKLYTASGPGLCTPRALTDAVVAALEKRGFKRANILLIDQQELRLREAGYLPVVRDDAVTDYKGSPVLALDTGKYFDAKPDSKWTYPECKLPSKEFRPAPEDFEFRTDARDTLSHLPMPLLFEVDFWINLPMACDNATIGVSGALANATLLNIGNSRRFWDNPANAQKAVVEIAAIPELKEKMELTLLTLEKYQFVGGPKFDASFTVSEKRMWLSANPVILDYLLWKRFNDNRVKLKFDPIAPEPGMFLSANSGDISLGSCRPADLKLVQVK